MENVFFDKEFHTDSSVFINMFTKKQVSLVGCLEEMKAFVTAYTLPTLSFYNFM